MQIEKIHTQFGDICIPQQDIYIRECLKQYKIWEPNTLKVCLEHINSESIVVEVGAHVGSHTIPLARNCFQIYAFEMQRSLFQILNTNCVINNITNVIPFLGGVSNENKKTYNLELDWKNTHEQINSGNIKIEQITDVKENQKSFLAMDVIKLDDHLKLLSNLHLLKIDVEGHELQVLEGAKDLIKRFKPTILTECHVHKSNSGERGNAEIIEKFLKQCGNYTTKIYKETININNKDIDNLNMLAVPE